MHANGAREPLKSVCQYAEPAGRLGSSSTPSILLIPAKSADRVCPGHRTSCVLTGGSYLATKTSVGTCALHQVGGNA